MVTPKNLTAGAFLERLMSLRSDDELRKYARAFRYEVGRQPAGDHFIGVRMGEVFKLGKEFCQMPVEEIERLMENPVHEARAGAMSIMGQCAKSKGSTEERLSELYQLYLRRHDRINNWDLVDLAAYYVVGKFLADKPRDPLYKLAASRDMWERRTAIVATAHFILKLKQTDDTFRIARLLINEPEDLVNKATGWMLRTAGDVDREALLVFLNEHAAHMPRVMLRSSIEKLDKGSREHYLKLR